MQNPGGGHEVCPVDMTKTIAITSGKGGVGKSNVAVNLSIQLGRLGHKACLFDADLGLANANILLGLYPDKHLDDLIEGRAGIGEIVISGSHGIDIIPGSSGIEHLADLSGEALSRLFDSFSYLDKYDYLVFDTSSGIHDHVLSFCQAADELVVVITPEPTSLVDAYALLKVLCRGGHTGKARIIINKCRNKEIAKSTFRRFRAVVKARLPMELSPLGMILRDPWMEAAVAEQKPLMTAFPDAVSSKCIRLIANRLAGDGLDGRDDMAGFWSLYFDKLSSAGHILDESDGESLLDSPADMGSDKAIPDDAKPLGDTEYLAGKAFPGDTWAGPPIHPRILASVLEEVNDGGVDPGQLAGLIGLDPGFTFLLLLSANAERAPGEGEIVDLREAVRRLGTDTVRGMALSASAGYVSRNGAGTPGPEYMDFLRHSVQCALLAAKIASRVEDASVGEAYIAGLIHDLGFMVEKDRYRLSPGSYGKIPWEDEEKAERKTNGQRPRHCEIGSNLIRKWNLPPLMADAANYHHEPDERIRDAFTLTRITHMADALARDDLEPGLGHIERIYGFTGFTPERINRLKQSAVGETEEKLKKAGVTTVSKVQSTKNGDVDALIRGVSEAARLDGFTRRALAAGTRAEVVQSIQLELALSFGIRRTVVFLRDAKGDRPGRLKIPDSTGASSFGRMEVDIDGGAGLPSDAYLSGETRYRVFEEGARAVALVDEQLLRLLGGEAMLCEPLMLSGRPVGVIVAGMGRDELAALQKRLPLLHSLSSRAASALTRFQDFKGKKTGPEFPSPDSRGALASIHKVRDGLRGLENSLRSENGTREHFNEIRVHVDLIESMIDEILDENEDGRFSGPPVREG